MFCPKCGKQLPDNANFCTGCGEKLNLDLQTDELEKQIEEPADTDAGYEEPAEEVYEEYQDEEEYYEDGIEEYYEYEENPGTGKKKLFIILGIVIAAAIAAVLCVYFFVIRGNSSGSLETSAEKTSTALMERSDLTAFMNKASENGKIGISIKADDLGSMLSAMNSYLGYIDISGEISMAGDKNGNGYAAFNIEAMGQEINAGAYIAEGGEGDLVVSVPSVLKDTYGISFKSLEEDFDDSIFSPDSDSDYAIDEYSYEQVKQYIAMVSKAGDMGLTAEDLEQLKNDLKNNEDTKIEVEKTKDKVDIGDDEVKCDIYTAEIDEEKLANIIEYIGEWLEDNEKVQELLDSLMKMSGSYMPSVSELIPQLVEQISDVDIDGSVEFDVYKSYLARVDGSFKIDGEKVKFEIVFGADPATTEEVKASFSAADNSIDITADLSKIDDNEVTVEIESENDEIYFELGFRYDDEEKEFEATAKNAYTDLKISGGMDVTDDQIAISDIKFSNGGEEMLDLKGIGINISRDPEIKSMKDDFKDGYTNILTLKESEFEELIEEAQEAVYSLAG